ncbi:hypothetical protein [Fodinicurvata halophila]|uniref:hypothetical protein n=1 Tax=Fodinicurvata halophila TaxID=1419723 RepID=UPI003640F85A
MTKQISVTPCSALSRLLESRPTCPDINRSTHIELGYTDVPVSRIPENDAINRMAARYEWTLSQGFLLDEEAWMLLLNSEISRSEFALDELMDSRPGLWTILDSKPIRATLNCISTRKGPPEWVPVRVPWSR